MEVRKIRFANLRIFKSQKRISEVILRVNLLTKIHQVIHEASLQKFRRADGHRDL